VSVGRVVVAARDQRGEEDVGETRVGEVLERQGTQLLQDGWRLAGLDDNL